MSMSELTDDQLDGLFRKSAEEFDPPFDPAAWQDMKTRLDSHDRPTPGGTPPWKNLLRWGLPVGLLLLTMAGLYMYLREAGRRDSSLAKGVATQSTNAHTGTQPEVAKAAPQRPVADKQPLTNTAAAPSTAAVPPAAGPSAISVDPTQQSTRLTKPVGEPPSVAAKPAESVNKPDGFTSRNGEMTPSTTTGETNKPSVAYRQKRSSTKRGSIPTDQASTISVERSVAETNGARRTRQRTGTVIAKSSRRNKMTRNSQTHLMTNGAFGSTGFEKRLLKTAFDNDQPATAKRGEHADQPMIEQPERAGLPDVRALTIRPANWPMALAFTNRVVDAPPVETELMAVVPTPPMEKGLSVRLAIAPDLSSIGLRNFARPGTNVGVLLEYRLAPRWSVQTGIIQSTKIYRASATDYELSDYYKKGAYTIPQGADGQCKMLDIPLNIRYDILLRPRADGRLPNRWFITGGVTSYIIEREKYVYQYTGYVHKAIPDWSGKSDSYGFSQLNLSVGYERALTKRLSWQVEPFIKMPLKEVGYLKLNLLSTGTFFSIRYKL